MASQLIEEDPWRESSLKESIVAWKLNAAEEQQLRVLKVKLQDVKHPWNDPQVVLGFVEAFGYKHTEHHFRKMIQWRLRNKIDKLLKDYKPHPLLLDNSPVAILKEYDHEGDPVYLERGGACDAKGLLKRFGKEELMKHSIWLREVQSDGEWIDEYRKRQGRPVVGVTVVYDLQGLCHRHLSPHVLGFFSHLMKLTDENYPGPIKRMVRTLEKDKITTSSSHPDRHSKSANFPPCLGRHPTLL